MTEAQAAESPELSAGQILQKAREHQGLSRRDAADSLNLTVGIIEAIETDRYDLLPPRTFVRGYMRSYARLVGVEEASVLTAFEKEHPEPTGEPVRATAGGLGAAGDWLKWTALLIVLALLGYAGYESYKLDSQETAADSSTPEVLEQEAGVAAEPAEALSEPPHESSTDPATTHLDTEQTLFEPIEEQPQGPEPVVAAEPAGEAEPDAVELGVPQPEPVEAATDMLLIDIAEESWIEVTDGHGVSLHTGLVQGPQSLRLSGAPPFKLVIGNADKVTLQYDGEPVDLQASTRRNVARLTLP